jgi:hypothetical protein
VPNDFINVGPKATRETLARAGYPLLSGEDVVRAIALVGGTPEED